MDADMTVMSEKGQVVIPSHIRKRMKAGRGTRFMIICSGDWILLKKINTPTKMELLKELHAATRSISEDIKTMGITEKELIDIAVKTRKR